MSDTPKVEWREVSVTNLLPTRGEVARRAGGGGRVAYTHLIFWFLFSQGGVIAALLIPVHVLIQGILGPLTVVPVVDRHYDTWVNVLGNPLVKLYLLVLIAVPFFHFAHRLRYLLVDFGVHAAKSVPAQVVFYGGAVAVTLVTIWVLLTTVPIKLG
jgi:fumarate reductase subunit D